MLPQLIEVKNKLDNVGCGFCLAKWTQVTIHLGSGLTHSCHHVKAHPIDLNELDVIIESVSDVDTELCRKLRLVKGLIEDGKPYKKILREKYGYVA